VKLETADARSSARRPDPRLQTLERENQRLREELRQARDQRDELEAGVREALQQLGRA
jgi:hypothetical protein